jgi:hypothetical protein
MMSAAAHNAFAAAAAAKVRADLGRFLDAASRWQLTAAQLKVLLGDLSPAVLVEPSGERLNLSDPDLIERVVLICRIRRGLADMLGDDALVLRWLHDPQAVGAQDGIAPLDRMMSSRVEALHGIWRFLEGWAEVIARRPGKA